MTEVDENNGEDRTEHPTEHSGNKGTFLHLNDKAVRHGLIKNTDEIKKRIAL